MKKTWSVLLLLAVLPQLLLGQEEHYELLKPKDILDRVISEKFRNVPKEVRDYHAKGTVVVRIVVNEKGNIEKISLIGGISNSKPMKDFLTKEISSWKFKPLERDGKNVPFRGIMALPFCYGGFPEIARCK
jgi:TonB family protein